MSDFAKELLLELEKLGASVERSVIYHTEIDSTSTDLKRRLASGSPSGTVVAAALQTNGRGRSGRMWYSPAGGNLYVSLAVDLGGSPLENVSILPLAAGVAAWDAISQVGSPDLKLKWPNDVLMDGGKLAGILCELTSAQAAAAVVGLGVNIATEEFPAELAAAAVSLARTASGGPGGTPVSEASLSARWIARLENLMEAAKAGRRAEIIDAWRVRAEPFGRRVLVDGVEGVTVELAADGRLVVMKDTGERVAIAGGIVESAP